MRIHQLSMICFFLLLTSLAQGQRSNISLTFTGIIVGQNTQIDKLEIRNLNKECDTTLYWPDTVLVINYLGMNDFVSFNDELDIYLQGVNPVHENTRFALSLPHSRIVTIDISLVNGAKVASFKQLLHQGFHSFLFQPQSAGIFIITAFDGSITKSIKVLSSRTQQSSSSALSYLGTETVPTYLKSENNSTGFKYSFGDTLLFIGYHDSLANAFQDSPTNNKLYIINFPDKGKYCPNIPSVTYMGQTYNTVEIGNQCWFRENLNIGTMIDGNKGQANNSIIEKYCYNNDLANCTIYGGLYQWDEIMKYDTVLGTQGICPPGWHVPTFDDWAILRNFLGLSVAGGKMKSTGTIENETGLWNAPNVGATNESGFTALPSGYHNRNGLFKWYQYIRIVVEL